MNGNRPAAERGLRIQDEPRRFVGTDRRLRNRLLGLLIAFDLLVKKLSDESSEPDKMGMNDN
jgi:hypothetical protein